MIEFVQKNGGFEPQKGGILNNMPPLNPHAKPWSGVDWLTLTYQMNWGSGWERVRSLLDSYQTRAMELSEAVDAPEFGGKVRCWGGSIAAKKCRFGIERPDAIILIADQCMYRGEWPNVKVEISGERCLVYPGGVNEAMKSVEMFFDSFGAHIHKERVSRVDFCCDMPGMSIAPFERAYHDRRWGVTIPTSLTACRFISGQIPSCSESMTSWRKCRQRLCAGHRPNMST
jgi:hypothetical protein